MKNKSVKEFIGVKMLSSDVASLKKYAARTTKPDARVTFSSLVQLAVRNLIKSLK
jgi:hypothetical protein